MSVLRSVHAMTCCLPSAQRKEGGIGWVWVGIEWSLCVANLPPNRLRSWFVQCTVLFCLIWEVANSGLQFGHVIRNGSGIEYHYIRKSCFCVPELNQQDWASSIYETAVMLLLGANYHIVLLPPGISWQSHSAFHLPWSWEWCCIQVFQLEASYKMETIQISH